jgi:hypothetical protein
MHPFDPHASLPPLDASSAGSVVNALRAGASANRNALCRKGAIDVIHAPGELIATGDLHDNPTNYRKLVMRAGMTLHEAGLDEQAPAQGPASTPSHLTLHEIIHSDRLWQGMDMSYRMLTRVAHLKARYPEHVHTLLGNHELAQLMNSTVMKDGVKCVQAYNEGLDYVFGDDAPMVREASDDFIRSMPLALEAHTPAGVLLCAHSLPPAGAMQRFDATILHRNLTPDDYTPRIGSAYTMVWGRGYDAEGLEDLVERWGVTMFILGHEKAEEGVLFVPPNAIVLASDHERGTFLPIDLANPPKPHKAKDQVVWLAELA